MKNLKKHQQNQPDIEDDSWVELVKDVHKLPQPEPPSEQAAIYIDIKPVVNIFSAYNGDNLENLSADSYANIDNRTAQKFKREEYKVEAVLDLHGQSEKNAYDLVYKFVTKAYYDKKRCVIIVTGKGNYHQDDEDIFTSRGILKNCLPGWLNSPELRPLILTYKHPSEAKGGSGAFYILLRRQRQN